MRTGAENRPSVVVGAGVLRVRVLGECSESARIIRPVGQSMKVERAPHRGCFRQRLDPGEGITVPHAAVHVFLHRPRHVPERSDGTPETETESRRARSVTGDKRAGEDERIHRGRVCGFRTENRGKRMNDELVEAEIAAMALEDTKRGDADAQYVVAVGLSDGRDGFERNAREALVWLQCAAAQGNEQALYVLGLLHESGDGVPQDPVEVQRLYTLAATQEHFQAFLKLEANVRHRH